MNLMKHLGGIWMTIMTCLDYSSNAGSCKMWFVLLLNRLAQHSVWEGLAAYQRLHRHSQTSVLLQYAALYVCHLHSVWPFNIDNIPTNAWYHSVSICTTVMIWERGTGLSHWSTYLVNILSGSMYVVKTQVLVNLLHHPLFGPAKSMQRAAHNLYTRWHTSIYM